jgi:NADH:ubiquinone oxidoreductase subunit 6 (subunit J)
MKTLRLILMFILLLVSIYCTMIVITSDDPIYVVLFLFWITFLVFLRFINQIKEFYNDSETKNKEAT